LNHRLDAILCGGAGEALIKTLPRNATSILVNHWTNLWVISKKLQWCHCQKNATVFVLD
jgi:hypothetical protein